MAVSLYLIFGEDDYLVAEKAKSILDELIPLDQRALGLETIDGQADTVAAACEATARCIEAVRTVGFMGQPKVTWFRGVSFLADNAVGCSDAVKASVNRLVQTIKEGLPSGQSLMVTSLKVDKRYAFYKACSAAGVAHEFAVSEKSFQADKQASVWLAGAVSRAGLKMSSPVAQTFLQRVGSDTRQLANELEKLRVYIAPRASVAAEDVESITGRSRGVPAWDLADAFGKRDLGHALAVLRKLVNQGEAPMRLIIGLEQRLRDLWVYREALDQGWLRRGGGDAFGWGRVPASVDKLFGEKFGNDPRVLHPYRTRMIAEQAERFSRDKLEQCRSAIVNAHVKLVSSREPPLVTLELLLVRMLS